MKLNKLSFFAAALLLATAGVSHATQTGLTTLYGDYAIWDGFSSSTFTGVSAEASSGFVSTGLTQSASAGFPFGPQVANDLFYSSTTATSWTVSGSTAFEVTALTLQIKSSATGALLFTPLLSYGSTTGVTGTASSPVIADNVGGLGQEYVVTYTFTGLDIAPSQEFNFTFSGFADSHVAVDAIAINAVPEPSTWASIAMGLGLLVGSRRFMRRPKAA
jgi:hypothetical protein